MRIWAILNDTGIHFSHTVTKECDVRLILTHHNPIPPSVYPIETLEDLLTVIQALGSVAALCPKCSERFFAHLKERDE